MKSKSRKTAVLSVIILLLIMQLAFLNERKHEDNKTSIQLAERNVQDTSVSDKDAAYTEEIISTELNVVYRNTSSLKDISQEMEESKVKSSYDNKVVSYTLEELIIYSEPDLKSEPVGIMYSGSEADVLERGEEWSKIQSGKVTGYIRNVDVLFDSEAEVIASVIGNKQAKVNADMINVYAEADDSAAVISTLEKGAEIDAYEENGNYTLISCDNGFGYISNDSFDVSYNLSKAVSMAEIEAIKEEERAEAAPHIAVDYLFHPRPLGLAKLLLTHGFQVQSVFLDSISPEEKEVFFWLKENYPELRLISTVRPEMRVRPRQHSGKLLAIGQKAAWFTGSRNFVNMVQGGGLWGFDGIRHTAQLMVEAFHEEKDPEDLIVRKGWGCESCI